LRKRITAKDLLFQPCGQRIAVGPGMEGVHLIVDNEDAGRERRGIAGKS